MGPVSRSSRQPVIDERALLKKYGMASLPFKDVVPKRRKTARKGGLSIVDRGSAEPRASHYAARTSREVRIQVASADDRGERQ